MLCQIECEDWEDGAKMIETSRELADRYRRLGMDCFDGGNYAKAREWHRKYMVVLQQLAEATGTIQIRVELSFAYADYGEIFREEGNTEEAEVWYRRGVDIANQLMRESRMSGLRSAEAAEAMHFAGGRLDELTSYCDEDMDE